MALQVVLGSSGEGKSYELYSKIIKDARKHPEQNFIIIVPEQFTLQTQKELVAMDPKHGIMNIDILSFLRLSYRIFEEIGQQDLVVLEETGKSMLVRKALEEKKESLTVLKGDIKKSGFVAEVKSLLSEFMQYSIGLEELEKMVELTEKKPLLQAKLEDTLLVYRRFRELLEHKYITAEEVLEALCDSIEESRIIRNSTICFDGFTGFTPNQYKVLEKLMILCPKVYVTVTLDRRESLSKKTEKFQLFHLSKQTIDKLYQIARDTKTEILEPWYAGKGQEVPYRYRNSKPLAVLERNLFRFPYQSYSHEQNDIQIMCASSPKGEVLYTISQINYLIREKGYRYRDIAVVTGDVESYANIIEREFYKAGFTFFLDHKKDIRSNPFIELLRSMLTMFNSNFTYESVFRYLRTGLLDFSEKEIDVLENYCIAHGIRGLNSWKKPFRNRSKRENGLDYGLLNNIRGKMMEPLLVFEQEVKESNTVLAYTKALYQFIAGQNIFEKLEAYCGQFEEEEKPLLVKEFQQIYRIIMDLFDKMVELLGDETVTLKEYEELLDTGYSEIKVGLIPPGVDQIVIGDIERTRLKDIKALFFIGVNDGVIPKIGDGGGLLSDMDREAFQAAKLELAPTKRENAYTEQFYLYLNMTKPSERLYLTYCNIGADGKAKKPSYLIGKMKKLYSKLQVLEESNLQTKIQYILDADKGLRYLLGGLRNFPKEEQEDAWKELFTYYWSTKKGREKLLHLLDGVYYKSEEKGLSKAVVKALYGEELENSVTRLEQYASCAFAHFMAYGLALQERKQFQVAIPDIGDLFHAAIENFSKEIKKNGFTWHQLSTEDMEGQRELFVKEAVIQAVEERGNDAIFSTKRNEYLVTRLERMTSRTVWALCKQIAQGDFEPAGYEVSFTPIDNRKAATMPLGEEFTMRLKGRIDRVDSCEDEENVYVKIIDYKSGTTGFDLQKIYYGLQLQLVVYLDAAMEITKEAYPVKKVIPAGIFYYRIEDPMIERLAGKPSKEEMEEDILKELKVNGLVNEDREILKKLDHIFAEEKSVKSKVIPVELTAKGAFSAYSSVAKEEQFYALTQYAKSKLQDFGQEIVEGNTKAEPYKLEKRTACDYCKYDGICGFDKKLPGSQYRMLKKMDKDSIWEEIHGKCEMDNGTTESN
ncbi:helicase-exonuclease AddAB subunit AddB [[Clostridium] polysaccharolyticum]|uniref:DNA helicase/exodeoxyribonuclease V, subunit B n=1 Tax=[Clostridium] polysaccharolyticum TaxID=29364 RepID=A0A1H9ZIN3_9FIRM|nr:helicase-exonuclease AddAB subunit AddB [[Clostridium] polysaccharolyticum]SES80689.1 DNA helicase/exodeoxyribonuclease V, subunit B [[Clostridium] polysaccharolyticum]